jgi:hypothetical protein
VSAPAAGCFVVHLRWRRADAEQDRELFQVLRVSDDRIREITTFGTARDAAKAAKHP